LSNQILFSRFVAKQLNKLKINSVSFMKKLNNVDPTRNTQSIDDFM